MYTLKCKKCGKELEEGQKFCPECGTSIINETTFISSNNKVPSKSLTKIIIGILVGFMAAVAFFSFFVALRPINVTYREFYKAYLDNEKVADQKYKNKPIKITGKIVKTMTNGSDGVIIVLARREDFTTGRWIYGLIVTTEKYKYDASFINTAKRHGEKNDYATIEGTCVGVVKFREGQAIEIKLDKITY